MSASLSQQTTTTANYSVSKIKKPVLINSHSVAKPKEKSQSNNYTFVGIAG